MKVEILVKLSNGATTTVIIDAKNDQAARQLAEAQYGRGNVTVVRYINE